ncbi:MAG: ferritin [Thermoplasmata archaeon]
MPRYERIDDIDSKTADLTRARQSLIEEIEAMMFYDERASATKDQILREIMIHNRDDEKEHAALLIEYLRRNDPEFDKELKEILFSSKEFNNLFD